MSRRNHLDSLCKYLNSTGESFSNCNPIADEDQQSHGSHSSGVSELPPSIILHILVKLPIKSISRCRCVCKAWYELMLEPYFANMYSKSYPFTAIALLRCPKFYIPSVDEVFSFLEIGSDGDVIRTPFSLKPLNFLRIGTSERTTTENCRRILVGSCNGLLCLVETPYFVRKHNGFVINNQTIWVLNPLTGESTEVEGTKKTSFSVIYGFGSTVDGDYYKLVSIATMHPGGKLDSKILTIGVDDEWRDFDDPAIPRIFYSLGGVALNGFLHWVGHDWGSGFIYAFDVGKEIGHSISLPHGARVSLENTHLGVWDGCLCLTQTNVLQFDIWTMKRYGDAESWTRDIIVKSPTTYIYPHAIPIMIRRNGDLLISILSKKDGPSLISFDPKTKNHVKLEGVFYDKEKSSCLFGYDPSLFSLGNMISRRIIYNPSI